MYPSIPRLSLLLPALAIGLAACGLAPVTSVEEAPLQPPPSFCDLSVSAPDGAGVPDKKTERP